MLNELTFGEFFQGSKKTPLVSLISGGIAGGVECTITVSRDLGSLLGLSVLLLMNI